MNNWQNPWHVNLVSWAHRNCFQDATEGLTYFLMTAFSLSLLQFSNCASPQNVRQRMREEAALTDLRNKKLLMAILISLSDSCCCFSTTNTAGLWSPGHAWVHSLVGSEEAFLCTVSGLKFPASAWPPLLISPSPFLWQILPTDCFEIGITWPFWRYLQEGLCPIHLFWDPHIGEKYKYLCKYNGQKFRCPCYSLSYLSHVSPATFSSAQLVSDTLLAQ